MHIKLPAEYADVSFFAITGHEHQYGTNVLVSSATSKADPGTTVYDVKNWLWSEPATVQDNFKLPKGGGFGESANNAMCFFGYPSKGDAKVCVHIDRTRGNGVDAADRPTT